MYTLTPGLRPLPCPRRFLHRPAHQVIAVALAGLAGLAPSAAHAGNTVNTAPAGDDAVAAEGTAKAPQTVEVSGRHYDNAVGSSDAASQGVIRAELLQSRPALRPGEVLEFVPGLVVTQHSGDGKANQYFLRGFNLDHGTDFATTVNGLPVNMPSHGHGQGYSDLNFLVPELVERISYRKGPYFATHGDFAAAGAADIEYRSRLSQPLAQLSLGGEGYRRALGAVALNLGSPDTPQGFNGQPAPDDTPQLWAAVESMTNNGPWTLPERLQRHNALLRLSQGNRSQGASLGLMAYEAQWDATDQVPQRLIDAGQYQGRPFGRFDAIDPSDGGRTARTSLDAEWHRRGADSQTRLSAWALRYRLQLFSNFTYALEHPDTGDQFSQQDARNAHGAQASQSWDHTLWGIDARSEIGAQWRQDQIRVGLYDTLARQTLATTRLDDVRQSLTGLYAQTSLAPLPWLRAVAGLRHDSARFSVDSRLLPGQPVVAQAEPGGRPLAADGGVPQRRARLPQQRRPRHHQPRGPQDRRGPEPRARPGGRPRPGAGPAHRGHPRPADFVGPVAAALRQRAGLRGRRRRHRSRQRQPPPRPRAQQPLDPQRRLAAGRRPGLDPRPLRQRRPHPQCRGHRGQRGRHPPSRPLVHQPAMALAGQRRADRGRQRAQPPGIHVQPAAGAQPAGGTGAQRAGDAGCVQPGQPEV